MSDEPATEKQISWLTYWFRESGKSWSDYGFTGKTFSPSKKDAIKVIGMANLEIKEMGFKNAKEYIDAIKSNVEDKKETYLTDSQVAIVEVCEDIKKMLLDKNRKYGDSALNPVRVFSQANPIEQIKVRLDDKLSRLQSEQIDEDEDVVNDLIGYLVLLKIALRNEASKSS